MNTRKKPITKNPLAELGIVVRDGRRTIATIQANKHPKIRGMLTLALGAKSIRNLAAVGVLCKSKYGDEAEALARVSYEALLQIAHLNSDLTKRNDRTRHFLYEGELDRYEDAKFLDKYKAPHVPQLSRHLEELEHTRKKIRDDRAFKDGERPLSDPNSRRWRKVSEGQRLQYLNQFFDRLLPMDASFRARLEQLDYILRQPANRQLHSRPSAVDSVITIKPKAHGRKTFVISRTRPVIESTWPAQLRVNRVQRSQAIPIVWCARCWGTRLAQVT